MGDTVRGTALEFAQVDFLENQLNTELEDAMSTSVSTAFVTAMGANHGGQGTSPPEFGAGDANANYPPYFVMFQNFKYLFNSSYEIMLVRLLV